jgi:NitT/TauT family transport system substrate-binding protein
MNKYRRTATAILAGIALFCAAATVHADTQISQASAPPMGDGGKVRLLYNQPGTNSFVPFVIKKFALDKKYGIEIVPVPTTTTPAAITAIQSGAAEVGTFGWNDVARMRNAGIKVTGVAPFLRWGADFIVVPTTSPIKTIGDLKGKKVGTGTRTALNWIVMSAVAKKDYKLDTEKDMIVHEGAPPLLRALAEQGQLDATHMFNSVTPSMVVTGKFRVLAKISDLVNQYGLPDTPFLLYAMDMGYAATKPNNVRAFVAAYQDAVKILRTDDTVWMERGRELQFPDEASALFRTEGRTDVWLKFEPDTEANIRKIFDVFLPIAGVEAMGISKLDDGFMTLQYQ